MNEQYRRKEEEVAKAIGMKTGDYLTRTKDYGRKRKENFRFERIAEKKVMEKINRAKNKESFGEDEISYGFIKKMKGFIAKELTDIMNHSLKIGKFPTKWKISKVKLERTYN